MSSVAVLRNIGLDHDESDWFEFESDELPAPLIEGPWVERVDEAMLINVNPVVVAMRSRLKSAADRHRDLLSGLVPGGDTTPDLTEDAATAFAEWADE